MPRDTYLQENDFPPVLARVRAGLNGMRGQVTRNRSLSLKGDLELLLSMVDRVAWGRTVDGFDFPTFDGGQQ